jgi:CPA2 family monovalent cation:H+ antiporter-2
VGIHETTIAGVTLPPIAEVGVAIIKAGVFAALMVVVGGRVVPWLLIQVARDGARELFTLTVLALAIGIAFAASSVFGVSFALGAFLAGAVVSESDMSHQAAQDALPMRDAFSVLFFVSVGMLLDPTVLLQHPLAIVAIVIVVVVIKSFAAFAIVALVGYPPRVGLTVSAGLAQIGEFSFILATAALALDLLPEDGVQLIVAGSLLSITLNPFVFRTIEPMEARLRALGPLSRLTARRAGDLARLESKVTETLTQHAIICGYGRVGRLIGPALERRGFKYVVVTQQREDVDALRARGIAAVFGDPTNHEVLELVHVERARVLVIASRDPHETRLIVEHARKIRPDIDLIVRTHSDAEAAFLRSVGTKVQVIHGEREVAVQMARYALRRFGVSAVEAEAIAQGLRDRSRAGA